MSQNAKEGVISSINGNKGIILCDGEEYLLNTLNYPEAEVGDTVLFVLFDDTWVSRLAAA